MSPNSAVTFSWQGKLTEDATSNYCVYDSDIATGLGVGSFLFLMASQVLIVVASRCLCCGKALRPSAPRAWAICLFITCSYVLIINTYIQGCGPFTNMICFRCEKSTLAWWALEFFLNFAPRNVPFIALWCWAKW